MHDEEYRRELLPKEVVELHDHRLYPVVPWIASELDEIISYTHIELTENGNSFRISGYSRNYEILSGDDVVYEIPTSALFNIHVSGKFVLVVYEGEDVYYLYDIGTLEVTKLRGNKAVRVPVGLEEYLSGSENGVKLDPKILPQLTVDEVANVMYVAMRRQDRDTLQELNEYHSVYYYRPEKYADFSVSVWYHNVYGRYYFDVYFHGEKVGWDVYVDMPYHQTVSEHFYFAADWTGDGWRIEQFPGW